MEFKHFAMERIRLESVLRPRGKGPQSLKMMEAPMECRRVPTTRILATSVLRSCGKGPQSLKMMKALRHSNILQFFEVRPSLAVIILKGYLREDLKGLLVL